MQDILLSERLLHFQLGQFLLYSAATLRVLD